MEYAHGGWLTFAPSGHYVAGGEAAEWARVKAWGLTYPLSSYAALLESPEKVKASLAGELVEAPDLPHAPFLSLFGGSRGTVTLPEVRIPVHRENKRRYRPRWPSPIVASATLSLAHDGARAYRQAARRPAHARTHARTHVPKPAKYSQRCSKNSTHDRTGHPLILHR